LCPGWPGPQTSYLHLLSAGTTDVYHNAQPISSIFKWRQAAIVEPNEVMKQSQELEKVTGAVLASTGLFYDSKSGLAVEEVGRGRSGSLYSSPSPGPSDWASLGPGHDC
jgi:hypothetical protein